MEGSMFDDTRDVNRDLGHRDPYLNRYTEMSDGSGYAPLIALAAIALIVGGLIMFAPSSDKTQTASNTPAIQRTVPPVSPIPPAPPTTAPTAPQQ